MDAVTLAPEQEVTVVVDVAPPPCISIAAGSSVGLERLALRVRSLGVTTDEEVALPLPVSFRGPVVAEPGTQAQRC